MTTNFIGIPRTHTVTYRDQRFAIIAYLGDYLYIGNPMNSTFWIHKKEVTYEGKQNEIAIPSRGYQ